MRGLVANQRSQAPPVSPLRRLTWFVLSIAAVSLLLSVVARVWIDLSWWKVFRRCVSVAAALTLWVFVRHVEGQSLRSLGLGSWKQGKWHVAQGVGLGLVAVLLMMGVYLAMGACRIAVDPDLQRVVRSLLGFIPAAGLVALLEELLFRGYVLQRLSAYSQPLAVVGSSAAYALVHLKTTFVWPNTGFELVGLFILGCVLAQSVLRTKQLYLAMGLHAALAYCAVVNKRLVAFTAPSLQWLVGTNRLVNGVMAWLVLLGVGWVVARWGSPGEITREG